MLADPDRWQDPSTARSSFAKGTGDLRTAKVSRIPAKPRAAARPYPPPRRNCIWTRPIEIPLKEASQRASGAASGLTSI
jgi:hypothetical protein